MMARRRRWDWFMLALFAATLAWYAWMHRAFVEAAARML